MLPALRVRVAAEGVLAMLLRRMKHMPATVHPKSRPTCQSAAMTTANWATARSIHWLPGERGGEMGLWRWFW